MPTCENNELAHYRNPSKNKITDIIIKVLKQAGKPITTKEILAEVDKRISIYQDTTAIFLNRLRIKGIINGEHSKNRRCWIWWIENSRNIT